MHNIILVLIAALSLVLIALLWLRHALAQVYGLKNLQMDLLSKECEELRDRTPYLLEFAPESVLRSKVLSLRVALAGNKQIEKEEEFIVALKELLNENSAELGFVHAKARLSEVLERIEICKSKLKERENAAKSLGQSFPYSLASAIFGFK